MRNKYVYHKIMIFHADEGCTYKLLIPVLAALRLLSCVHVHYKQIANVRLHIIILRSMAISTHAHSELLFFMIIYCVD